MQMFVLDADPELAAQSLSDAHVRVICREVTMLLSSWYYWNVPPCRHCLPYKPMNEGQPLAKQMVYSPVRRWANAFAGFCFQEFEYRFGKKHASEQKYEALQKAIACFDAGFKIGCRSVRFTFVAKGDGVFPGKTMSQAIRLYRLYYINKVRVMRVALVYTGRSIPAWLNL